MTKEELLAKMAAFGACEDATAYAKAYPSNDASVIWRECDRVDWLCWYIARVDRSFVAAFARRCAERAKGYAYADVAAAAAEAAAHAAAYYAAAANSHSAYSAAANAAYYAASAASAAEAAAHAAHAAHADSDSDDDADAYAAAAAEHKLQLADLHSWEVR